MKKSLLAILILLLACVCLFASCIQNNTSESEGDTESEQLTENIEPSTCEHEFGKWKTKIKANCKREGKEERRCLKCSVTETRAVVDLDAHSIAIDEAVPANCLDTGLTEGRHCTRCDKVLVEQTVIPITNVHDYQSEMIMATHKTQGYYFYTCKICKDRYKAGYFDFVPTQSLVYKNNEDGTCVVSGISDTNAIEVNIPEISPDGYIIKGIAPRAFMSNRSIKRLVAPESVQYVGERAFDGCSSLTDAFIPGVERIDSHAFSSCNTLKCMIYSDNMTQVGEKAFYGCRALKECRARSSSKNLDTIIKFGYMSFSMSGITDPTFSANLTATSLANSPFSYCSSLGCVDMSAATLTSLGAGFLDASFTEFIFPQGITTIPQSAFASCYFKTMVIPDSVTKIDYNAFINADFNKVILGSGVLSIGAEAFNSSHGEIDLSRATKLESIGYRAFANTEITSIILPGSVKSIGSEIFFGCEKLTVLGIPFISTSPKSDSYSTNCFGAIFNSSAESFTQEKYIPKSLKTVIITADSVELEYGDFNSEISLSVLVLPKNITYSYEALDLSLKAIYYCGNESEFSLNSKVYGDTKPTVYYYSESMPASSGKYWHYVNGVPTQW